MYIIIKHVWFHPTIKINYIRMKHRLSEKWIKASIAGTIWAASEIVLGSFLHNLRVPFSGNILTGIGLIILISISYIWTEKGIFWRAGLICALMKTMSPSAVIFGPMIAIFSEAVLLEASVRLLGRTMAGYLTGAMLAMSWNLFQKIANFIIFYGANIIEVYNNLLRFAQKQLNIQTDIVWLPIILLLVLFAFLGLIAGIMGIIIGKKMLKQPLSRQAPVGNGSSAGVRQELSGNLDYSIAWLVADVLLIIGSFILIYYTPWYVWSFAITAIIVIWALRYKRALRQISRPKFWIFFVFITLITAFALTKAQGGEIPWQQGILTGIQMNFRAAVIIGGCAVLGTELYNPGIRDFFQKTTFKNLPLALELSVESLPSFIAVIPDLKSLVKRPVSLFYQAISQADMKLSEVLNKNSSEPRVYLVTGPVGAGKTNYIKNLINFFNGKNIKTAGIFTDKIMKGSRITGYDVVDISTGMRKAFLRKEEKCGSERIGRFYICMEGLEMGKALLSSHVDGDPKVMVVDEVGLLEINGGGWADQVDGLLTGSCSIIMSVRDSYVDMIKEKWCLPGAMVFNVGKIDYKSAGEVIKEHLMAM